MGLLNVSDLTSVDVGDPSADDDWVEVDDHVVDEIFAEVPDGDLLLHAGDITDDPNSCASADRFRCIASSSLAWYMAVASRRAASAASSAALSRSGSSCTPSAAGGLGT